MDTDMWKATLKDIEHIMRLLESNENLRLGLSSDACRGRQKAKSVTATGGAVEGDDDEEEGEYESVRVVGSIGQCVERLALEFTEPPQDGSLAASTC